MVCTDLAWVSDLLGQDGEDGHYQPRPSDAPRWEAFKATLAQATDTGEIADPTGRKHRFVGYIAMIGGSPCAAAMLQIDRTVDIFAFSVIAVLRHQGIGKRFIEGLLTIDEFRNRAWVACCLGSSLDMKSMLLHRGFTPLSAPPGGKCVLGRGFRRG